MASDRFPAGGVFIYAMMAAGGDMGASVAPQLVGVIADFAGADPTLVSFAEKFSLSPDQFGMKLGMLVGTVFSLIGTFIYARLYKTRKK